jgi:hypothetical protein
VGYTPTVGRPAGCIAACCTHVVSLAACNAGLYPLRVSGFLHASQLNSRSKLLSHNCCTCIRVLRKNTAILLLLLLLLQVLQQGRPAAALARAQACVQGDAAPVKQQYLIDCSSTSLLPSGVGNVGYQDCACITSRVSLREPRLWCVFLLSLPQSSDDSIGCWKLLSGAFAAACAVISVEPYSPLHITMLCSVQGGMVVPAHAVIQSLARHIMQHYCCSHCSEEDALFSVHAVTVAALCSDRTVLAASAAARDNIMYSTLPAAAAGRLDMLRIRCAKPTRTVIARPTVAAAAARCQLFQILRM